MERLDALAEALKHVAELLAEDVLEPDPDRTDWAGMKVRVGMAREAMERALEGVAGALEEAEDADLKARIRAHVGHLAARTAALLHTAGSTEGCRRLLERALRVVEAPGQRAFLAAGLAEPEPFRRYHHAVWLLEHGRTQAADTLLRRVAKDSRQKALKDAAREATRGARPVERAPPLYTMNGVGVGLYGKRDAHPDGTYVATYCLCLLFVPVLPLTAYRVRSEDGNFYQFFTREPLGPVARAWRGLMLAGLAGVLVWAGVDGYLNSPARLARLALEEAQAAEATLSREAAINRYRLVIHTHADGPVRAQAGEALVRLSLVDLPSPCTRDSVEAVRQVVKGFYTVPPEALAGEAGARLGGRLEACSQEIGEKTPEDWRAALSVVEESLRVVRWSPSLRERGVELQRRLAATWVEDWPLRALAHYVGLPGKPSLDAAREILDTLGESPSLWLEAAESVQAWLDHSAQEPSRSPGVTRYRERLAAAQEAHTRDAALIEEGNTARILEALKASPGNQELTVALASQARQRGDAAEALRLLTALGPEGRLTREAWMLRGVFLRDLGRLPEADAVLSSYVEEHRAPFQKALKRYEDEARAVTDRLVARVRDGQVPPELKRQVEATADKEAQKRLLREWISAQVDADANLERLRTAYLRHDALVPATLTLGTVKMQRASPLEGEARRVLLADAERLLLSIRPQAEGNARFHLGLGQVYHRLGRTEEGDRELNALLERKEPELTLEVIAAYRELDHLERARALAETLHASSAPQEVRHAVAALRALMALGEEETTQWLRRADPQSPVIQDQLNELEARRLLSEGRLEEADRAAAQVVAFRTRRAKHSADHANNAANALSLRYAATGDATHLGAAARYQEDAVRLEPDSPLLVGNLADTQQHLGQVRVLERWVRTGALHLSSGQAEESLDVLLDSALREDVLQALSEEPALRRSQELSQQEQTLAPAKSAAWRRQLKWLSQLRDERGLAVLARRMEPLPPFTGSLESKLRRQRDAGLLDAELDAQATQRVAWAEAALKRAERTRHTPTLALAWYLRGEALYEQRAFESPAQLSALVNAYRQAEKLWPALAAGRGLERALVRAAMVRGAQKSEALSKVWQEGRRQSTAVVLHQALAGPSGREVAAVLRAQPELRTAAEHARRRPPSAPQLEDWMLAKAVGDAVLQQAAAAVFARPDVELRLAIGTKLSGDHPHVRATQALFQEGKTLQGRP